MAKVIEIGDQLVLKLSRLEKIGSLHKSLRVPKSSLVSIEDIPNPWFKANGLRGLRAPGTGLPGVVMLGTLRRKNGKEFAAVYGRGVAKVYTFNGGPFKRWIVSNR